MNVRLRPRRLRLLGVAVTAVTMLATIKAIDVGHRLTFGIGVVEAADTPSAQAVAESDADNGDEAASTAMAEPPPEDGGDATEVHLDQLTPGDLTLLQQLVERRAELDARDQGLLTREQALDVVERRVETKIAELKALQENLEATIARNDEAQEEQLRSLVKIYENMKPKDAAPIFDELESAILLDVIERMKEAKVAPILALMNPDRARAVTQDLARRRDLPATKAAAENN